MSKHFPVLIGCLLLAACSKKEQPVKADSSTASKSASTISVSAAAGDEEPPEKVLRDMMFRQNAVLEEANGLPVTVTATGQSGRLHSKLYEVRKEKCEISPIDPPGTYECGVETMGTLWFEGRREPKEPLRSAARMRVMKDPNGAWIDCTYNSDRDSVCNRSVKK